jgi:hypothetical protein
MNDKRANKDTKHDIDNQLQIMKLQLDLICAELKQQRTNYKKLEKLIVEIS